MRNSLERKKRALVFEILCSPGLFLRTYEGLWMAGGGVYCGLEYLFWRCAMHHSVIPSKYSSLCCRPYLELVNLGAACRISSVCLSPLGAAPLTGPFRLEANPPASAVRGLCVLVPVPYQEAGEKRGRTYPAHGRGVLVGVNLH